MIPPLLKSRPALAASLIPSLTSWTPATMQANGCSASQIRAVEKSLKVALVHLLRYASGSIRTVLTIQGLFAFAFLRTALFPAFGAQLNDALTKQKVRTDAALKAEKLARHEAAARRAQASASVTVKREHGQVGQALTDDVPSASKRQRLEPPPVKEVPVPLKPGEGLGPDFDVTKLSFDTMLELLYVTLNGLDEWTLHTTIEVRPGTYLRSGVYSYSCASPSSKHVED
jgi:symplekin